MSDLTGKLNELFPPLQSKTGPLEQDVQKLQDDMQVVQMDLQSEDYKKEIEEMKSDCNKNLNVGTHRDPQSSLARRAAQHGGAKHAQVTWNNGRKQRGNSGEIQRDLQ